MDKGTITLEKEESERMRADGFTKSFKSTPDWSRVVTMLGIVRLADDCKSFRPIGAIDGSKPAMMVVTLSRAPGVGGTNADGA